MIKIYLVDFWAEELFAFELNIGNIVGLRTIDANLAAKLNPGNSKDTSAKTTWKCNHIFFIVIHEGQFALTNIMNCHLKK